jgi:hypothetical protein
MILDLKSKTIMNKEIESLWRGTSVELLKALHILTRDGKLNADSRRKLKQVQHLTQLMEPMIQKIAKTQGKISLVDMGAGKSYLGFVLYDLILKNLPEPRLISIESRPELIEKSKKLAEDSQFDGMHFLAASIEEAKLDEPIDLVCALHACDTATDDAIAFGIRQNAKAFALVPCCQAEVAGQLNQVKGPELSPLAKHPLHRREFGSHLTNVIRTLYLSSLGYQVTVTELVGWEHSMKNELILAEKRSSPDHPESLKSKATLIKLLNDYHVNPKLTRMAGLEIAELA